MSPVGCSAGLGGRWLSPGGGESAGAGGAEACSSAGWCWASICSSAAEPVRAAVRSDADQATAAPVMSIAEAAPASHGQPACEEGSRCALAREVAAGGGSPALGVRSSLAAFRPAAVVVALERVAPRIAIDSTPLSGAARVSAPVTVSRLVGGPLRAATGSGARLERGMAAAVSAMRACCAGGAESKPSHCRATVRRAFAMSAAVCQRSPTSLRNASSIT